MNEATVTDLYRDLVAQWWGPGIRAHRQLLRAWEMSGVERLHPPQGPGRTALFKPPQDRPVIFKYAREPFHGEARVLAHAAAHRVPVPAVLAVAERPGMLGMLLEDLGTTLRPPRLAEAATAAAATHHAPGMPGLPVLDATGLAALPDQALAHLAALTGAGRWRDVEDITTGLHTLREQATARAAGADLPPFGLVHSEFHPTSLHITTSGWRLLDWARAFIGPGLLDLVSWQGTRTAPDLHALDGLLHAYTAAGGPADVQAVRGGLPAVRWAILWHRVWVITWYLEQATRWIPDGDDTVYQRVLRRHLDEALRCLP